MSTARVKLYDAADLAHNLRATFTDKPVKGHKEMSFSWPDTWHHVGDSLSVAYASDKWKKDGNFELYKHIAESRNRAMVRPGFLRDQYNPKGEWPTIGPMVSFKGMPMPKHFAVLGYFEEADLRLYTRGTDEKPEFGLGKNDGVVKVSVRHAKLGASKIMWEKVGKRKSQPFIFAYTESAGPLMFIVGEELDVEADGIVG
jgi:hypothetical protein